MSFLASCPSFQTSERSNTSPSHYSLATPIRTVNVAVQINDGNDVSHNLILNDPPIELSQEFSSFLNQFKIKQKKAMIDVYWLFDDGGTVTAQ